MMRRKILLAGSLAALLGASLVVIVVVRQPRFQKWLSPPLANLPEDSQVESLQVTIDNSEYNFDRIKEFDVPVEHIPRILYWFRQSQYMPDTPLSANLIGRVKIHTVQGRVRILTFYDFGVNPIVFTENKVDFYCGGGTVEPTNIEGGKPSGGLGYCGILMVGKAIREAHSEATKGIKD